MLPTASSAVHGGGVLVAVTPHTQDTPRCWHGAVAEEGLWEVCAALPGKDGACKLSVEWLNGKTGADPRVWHSG